MWAVSVNKLLKKALVLLSHLKPQIPFSCGISLKSTVLLGDWENWVLLFCYIKDPGGRVVTYLKYSNDGTLIWPLLLQQLV